MPVEIEAKIKVPDLEVIRQRLIQCNGTRKSSVMETNTFLDTDDRRLLASDQGLRIRHAKDPQAGTDKCTITFKGPRLHGPLKSREEREMGISNSNDAMALLESLGFHRILTFQKRRETWVLKGCFVELDELPHLGAYVEIEGPNEAVVFEVRDQLGLHDRPLIRASYIALLMTHLQERGINDRAVVFPHNPAPAPSSFGTGH